MVVSISDVAKKAGVAVSTVSKVLNNYPNISDATRKKVVKAANDLNYSPNLIASALSSKSNKRVALILFINNQRQAIDEINMQYLFGAFNKSKELNMEVVIIFSSIIQNMNEEEIIRYLRSQSCTGMIIYGLTKENVAFHDIINQGIFYSVVVDAPIFNKKSSSVMVDHYHGQYDVAKKTIIEINDKCHSVLYLAGGRDGYVTQMRLKGIMELRDEFGFDLWIEYCDFSELKAYNAVIEKGRDYDAIVCASDLMAIGAVNALKELNIFHLVCGYDGITLLGYIGFPMNTVKQDFYHISEIAIEEINNLFNGHEGKCISVEYELSVIEYKDVIM